MKFLKPFIVIFIAMAFIGCSKDDDSTEDTTAAQGELVASVENETFVSSDASTTAVAQSGTLNITGTSSAGSSISISMNSFEGEATFDLSGFTNEATAIYLASGENQFYNSANAGGSGSITITDFNEGNETVSGTFSFIAIKETTDNSGETVSESVEVSNGVFTNVAVSGLN